MNSINDNIYKELNGYLKEFEIIITPKQLLCFIEETTQLRESFKFEFTKNLSLALELLSDLGAELGFSRKMLSNLTIESLLGVSSSTSNYEIIDMWKSQIGRAHV